MTHVPPDALHRGPLWLLFPRGIPELPLLSSLLGVTVVWGALWIGIGLGLLVAVWAPSGRLCMGGWQYVLGRAAWSTTQALLVSAGSFLLWCASLHHVAMVMVSSRGHGHGFVTWPGHGLSAMVSPLPRHRTRAPSRLARPGRPCLRGSAAPLS